MGPAAVEGPVYGRNGVLADRVMIDDLAVIARLRRSDPGGQKKPYQAEEIRI